MVWDSWKWDIKQCRFPRFSFFFTRIKLAKIRKKEAFTCRLLYFVSALYSRKSQYRISLFTPLLFQIFKKGGFTGSQFLEGEGGGTRWPFSGGEVATFRFLYKHYLMTKKVFKHKCFSFITKNLNWKRLTKNLVTFKRCNGVKDEKFKYYRGPLKNSIFREKVLRLVHKKPIFVQLSFL